MKKKVLIGIVILILIAVTSLILYFIFNKNENTTNTNTNYIEVEGDEDEHNEVDWTLDLLKIARNNFYKVYNEKSTFDFDDKGHYKITFTEFKEKNKNIDMSEFDSKYIACNFDATYYLVIKRADGGYDVRTSLNCVNIKEALPEIFEDDQKQPDSNVKQKGPSAIDKLLKESKN